MRVRSAFAVVTAVVLVTCVQLSAGKLHPSGVVGISLDTPSKPRHSKPRSIQEIPRGGTASKKSARLVNNPDGASISNEIFNLVKSIVGAGVLGIPAGIAAFGDSPSALIPALSLIVGIGLLSSYGFALIGRVCAYTGAVSYRDAWEKSVGSHGWLPALCCLFVTSCSVLAYSMILSDTIPQLLETIGLTVTRTQTLLSLTSFVLLPLCLLKELKSLAPFSLVGISGMFYTTAAMAVRYFGGAYKEGGKLLESVAEKYQPAFGDKGASAVLHPNTFILVSMLSTGFMAHYLAHKFYRELRNKTIPRFQLVVRVSFLIATVIFCSVASLGFLTFGSSCSGLVLNNYSTKDTLMSLSRVAVAISLLTSYPLAFTGVRDGFLDFYGVPQEKRTNSFLNVLTLGLLSVITVLAFLVRDLRIVLAFAGATWGNALTYLFPTYMFMNLARKTPELKKEVPVVITTGLLGLAMGVVGTVRAIKSL